MSDPFAGVVGHTQALTQLRAELAGGRLAHAYLFVGEAGLGKSTAARAFATALLPEAPLGRNLDYWEDDRIKPLSINEIRLLPDKPPEFHELSLQAFLNLKPAIGARRVAVVANVGRLRDQDQGVLLKTLEEPHRDWTRRLEEVFGARADVPLNVAEELDAAQMAWRRSEGEVEDPALFALASWQVELRRRMLSTRGKEQGRWARLVELSYDTLGYLEQNVSPRLALETFLLECRKAS